MKNFKFKTKYILVIVYCMSLNLLMAQCPTAADATCNMAAGQYNNVVIGEVSGDSGQSDGCNDGIVEIVGPPGTNIGCMVVSNSEWAVLIPPGTVIPASGVFLIGCSADPNGSCGVGGSFGENGLIGNAAVGGGGNAGDFNTGLLTNILSNPLLGFDVCNPANASRYWPAATGFTIDNSDANDGDQVMLFRPDGTPHDGIYWGLPSTTQASTSASCPGPGGAITVGGASGAADAVVIQIAGQTYTLGDNDQNGIVNDVATSFYFSNGTSGRGDRGTMCGATMVQILPTDVACPCNTPTNPGTFTMPSLSDTDFWFNMNPNSETFVGCNSSYARAGTDAGAHGMPSHMDGEITNATQDALGQNTNNGGGATGGITGDSWTPAAYTPSSCGTQAALEAEWGYTDHPTPGQPNNDPAFIFYVNQSNLCSTTTPVTFSVEVYNYQNVSSGIVSGMPPTTGTQTGSYVFNPITGTNVPWTTYNVNGETTTMTYTVSSFPGPGTYTFGLVWDDYSNCCGTTGNPHSQATPNECYETELFTVIVTAPLMVTDADIQCPTDNPQGAINASQYITGGNNLTYELFNAPAGAPGTGLQSNTTGSFLLNTSAVNGPY